MDTTAFIDSPASSPRVGPTPSAARGRVGRPLLHAGRRCRIAGTSEAPADVRPAQCFVDALPIIDRVVGGLKRRHRLSRDEGEELLGFVRLRLIEDDYAILRRFEGRSRLGTYLRTVITRLFLDERVKAWGRWRPSAQAARLGAVAVALERLLERRHLPLEQAIDTMRASDPCFDERRLRELACQLPRRTGRHFVDDSVLAHLPAPGLAPDEIVERLAAGRIRGQVSEALRVVTATLPPRTRRLLSMRFVQGRSIADAARTLGCEQKRLYREIERALAQLRRGLEARGISPEHVRAVIAAGVPTTDVTTLQGRPS